MLVVFGENLFCTQNSIWKMVWKKKTEKKKKRKKTNPASFPLSPACSFPHLAIGPLARPAKWSANPLASFSLPQPTPFPRPSRAWPGGCAPLPWLADDRPHLAVSRPLPSSSQCRGRDGLGRIEPRPDFSGFHGLSAPIKSQTHPVVTFPQPSTFSKP